MAEKMSIVNWLRPDRQPDEFIGGQERPLIERWHIFRKSRLKFLENVYLHRICRSDDDRALHDHPWWNISIVLSGGYYEVMPDIALGYADGWWRGTHQKWRGPGSIVFRSSEAMHRIEMPEHPPTETWTLFITGRKSKEWGFFCPKGFVHWTLFGEKGCGT